MKLVPNQLHSVSDLNMKRCSLFKSSVYKDEFKSKAHTTQIS